MTDNRQPSEVLGLAAMWHHYLAVAWVVCIGAGFSLAVFFVVRWWESQTIEQVFRLAAEDRSAAVRGTFDTELGMLELIRSSLMADGKVEQGEFHEILVPFHSHDRSIEAVQWIPRVPDNRRQEFRSRRTARRIHGFSDHRDGPPGANGESRTARNTSRSTSSGRGPATRPSSDTT